MSLGLRGEVGRVFKTFRVVRTFIKEILVLARLHRFPLLYYVGCVGGGTASHSSDSYLYDTQTETKMTMYNLAILHDISVMLARL